MKRPDSCRLGDVQVAAGADRLTLRRVELA